MALEDFLHPWLEAYYRSPHWLMNCAGSAYAFVSPLTRGRHYPRFALEAALRQAQPLQQLALEKLRATLQWALETVPAYAPYRHLLSGLDAPLDVLALLPVMSKEIVRHDMTRYVSTGISARQRLKVATGGSTSVPMQFYLHKGVTRTREQAFIEAFQQGAGLGRREVVLALRGRTVPGAGRSNSRLWMYEPIKRELILSSDHLERAYMPAYLAAMRDWRPAYIQAYPSAIYPLARWLLDNPAPDVSRRIKGIMLFSENVLDHHKDVLARVFNCPVLQHYGQSERVLMAASMADDDRYFFFPQYGHFELLDEAGDPVTRPGMLGEIVGTGFDNRAMPFIRYRTGDMAILGDRPHPLLPGYPVVDSIEGRRQEFLVCRDRRLIGINSLTTPRYDDLAEVDDVQFEQQTPGHFLVKVVATEPLSANARRRIVEAMEEKTQGGCTAELIEVDQIARTRRGKQRMLVQHLDLSPYFSAQAH